MEIAQQADFFVIIDMSLQVYPPAGLMTYTPEGIPMFYIDKNPILTRDLYAIDNLQVWPGTATEGVEKLKDFFGKI